MIFTHNNYKETDLAKLQAADWVKYGVVGKEVGANGTPHLQGYLRLQKQMRQKKAFDRLADLFEKRPHMEPAKGSAKKNKIYCSKEGNFVEWGDLPKPGTRTDLHAMRDSIEAGKCWEYLAREHTSAHARYHKWGEQYRDKILDREAKEELMQEFRSAEMRDWQKRVIKRLKAQNRRQVLWVIDKAGGMGKTWLAKYLCVMQDAFYCEGGKKSDIAFAYKRQETVVFDLTRSTQEFVNYSIIESFKNGMMFSGKYESTVKVFKPAKVVVFSNWRPEVDKLSIDRWDILDLEPEVFIAARASATCSSDSTI